MLARLALPSPAHSCLQQGSQDSTGGQEGLVPPPFSAYPPPPPPQNGLGAEFGGSLFGAGGQGPTEAGVNSSSNVPSSLGAPVSVRAWSRLRLLAQMARVSILYEPLFLPPPLSRQTAVLKWRLGISAGRGRVESQRPEAETRRRPKGPRNASMSPTSPSASGTPTSGRCLG